MKKYFVILLGVVVGMISLTTFASANEGPHGAYSITTEKCAGCHRPHTAGSNKLLKNDGVAGITSNSIQDISEFCFSCHKDGLGANNNVYGGVFMGMTGPNNLGTTTDVTTNPWPGESTNTSNLGVKLAGLNGGGFVKAQAYWGNVDINSLDAVIASSSARLPYNGRTMRGVQWTDPAVASQLQGGGTADHFDHASQDASNVTSLHNVLDDTKAWTVWGSIKDSSGNGPGGMLVTLKCTSCHDQHGSRHYRILRDSRSDAKITTFFSGAVGAAYFQQRNEYNTADVKFPSTTTPIQSWESEFNSGSFTKDYTSYSYKKNGAVTISDFCKTCHSQYYNDNVAPPLGTSDPSLASYASYDAGDGLGRITRYRHFTEATMDRAPGGCLAAGSSIGVDGLGCAVVNMNKWIQLPVAVASTGAGAQINNLGERNGVKIYIASIDAQNDYMVCTTCHQAHGSNATTTAGSRVGPTATASATGSTGDAGINAYALQQTPTNLLRLDNRGVCEDCHGWTPAINEIGQPCSNEYGNDVGTECETYGSPAVTNATSDLGMNN